MNQHIGIFLCTCDGKIEQHVQVDAFQYVMRSNQDVALVHPMPHVCLPAGIHALQSAIRQHHLDRVVVAACPARFQEKHLQEVCTRAGVNVNHVALVDWREGCVDAHCDSKEILTGKAIDLIQMGVARVSHAQSVGSVTAKLDPRVLVIGGGIAGMSAARMIATRGSAVTLVEREAELGGQLRGVSLDGAATAFNETRDAVLAHPNIQVLLSARVVAVNGAVGDYHIQIAKSASVFDLTVGAIVVATGAQEYHDAALFSYDGRRVVTLSEFEEQQISRPDSRFPVPHSVVYILCAGARDEHHAYCSNICCLNALRQATRLKRANADTRVTILFRDLYLLGDELNDQVVQHARRAGVAFARHPAAQPPRVGKDFVETHDTLTNTTRRIEFDRVVLATPLVPRDDAGVIARLLKLARDDDGFFLDPHQRVRPEMQSERGIFVCGSAHRPVDMDTAIWQGMTAAARATRFSQRGAVKRTAWSAWVDPEICAGDGHCIEACGFGAIKMMPPTAPHFLDHSFVDPMLCVACGNCVAACPSKAIDLPGASDAQIFAQIDAALTVRHYGIAPILVFACEWSGYAAMELAGARKMRYAANTRVIELPCSARLDPLHVLYAFYNGAERVMLALCPPNECHFGNGNRFAEMRIENLRVELAAHGVDPERLIVAPMMGDDPDAWVRALQATNGNTRAAHLNNNGRN